MVSERVISREKPFERAEQIKRRKSKWRVTNWPIPAGVLFVSTSAAANSGVGQQMMGVTEGKRTGVVPKCCQ